MAIIIHSKDQNLDWARWNIYPDQFVPAKEKQTDNWIKSNMDYFANVAYSQFIKSKDTFVKNYNLVKGIITPADFYIEDDKKQMRSFTEQLLADTDLPPYVKHYSILGPPLNTLVGELGRRPDVAMVKAFDDDSKNEELQFKTDFLQQYIIENAKKDIMAKQAINGNGQQMDENEITKMTLEQVAEYLTDYTSTAEKWGARVLESLKVELSMKEVSEDCFRDFLISSREFYHVYEDHSKSGLRIENLNPKNTWYLTLPDKKYLKDAFAAGCVHVMELSEIIERFDLDKEEIDHLRKGVRELSLFSPRASNFENPGISGWDSIKYDTYSPYIVQQRLMAESLIKENVDPLNDFLGLSNNVNTFGNKYVVVQAYWRSKEKVGKLTVVDEHGDIQTMLVDESYKKVPNQVEIEWGYVNRWYKGLKVGSDVYKVEPLKMLDYCPILGVVHEIKNTDEVRSLVDMLKPYQVLYNICLNQLYKLLDKEIGNVYLSSIRHIPIPKDGDAQDALDIWEEEARKRGVVFVDDSPENLKSPSNFNMFKNVDLTRTQEIQSRYTLAQQLKQEAWELVGITRERTGGVAATQTATGTNAALSQSYAQTEPFFLQHEYVLNDVYQALLDAAQYIETQKPYSTIAYVNTEGEQALMKVNSEDIKLRDLRVFITSRAKDQQAFQELRQLAQPMLQNGATPYEIAVLYTSTSIRQMKDIFKSLKQKMEQLQQQDMQLKQAQIQQQQAQFEQEQQKAELQDLRDKEFQANQNELDRINDKDIALINASKSNNSENTDNSEAFDMNEMARSSQDAMQKEREYLLKKEKLQHDARESQDYIALEREKLKVDRERIEAQMAMKKADMRARKNKDKSK